MITVKGLNDKIREMASPLQQRQGVLHATLAMGSFGCGPA